MQIHGQHDHVGACEGMIVYGFDDDGYPLLMSTNLSAACQRKSQRRGRARPGPGRRYAATPSSRPMVVSAVIESVMPKPLPAIAKYQIGMGQRIPPSPLNLPDGYDFCIQENGMLLRHRDPNHELHGITVEGNCFDDPATGLRMCEFYADSAGTLTVPVCVDSHGVPGEVPQGCCVDLDGPILICPPEPTGHPSPFHGLIVEVVAQDQMQDGTVIASVEHPDLPGGGMRLPICRAIDRPKEKFSPADDQGDPNYSPIPPARIPDTHEDPTICCYDPREKTLVCPGTKYHGLLVEVVEEWGDIVSVEHPSLPGGGARVFVCEFERHPPPVVEEPEPPDHLPVPPELEKDPHPDAHPGICTGEDPPPPGPYDDVPVPPVMEVDPESMVPEIPVAPSNCCFHYASKTMVCPEIPEQHGVRARIVGEGHQDEMGRALVRIDHPDEGVMDIRICHVDCEAHSQYWGDSGGEGRRFAGFSGRPNEIPQGTFTTKSCYSRNSKGWKPAMTSLHQGALCKPPWGRLGMENVPNISGDPEGYDTHRFRNDGDILKALRFLGYRDDLSSFQSDWNWVSQSMATWIGLSRIPWIRMPKGNLIVDSDPGPWTLNALSTAIENQKGGINWQEVVEIAKAPNRLGREKLYSAKGW